MNWRGVFQELAPLHGHDPADQRPQTGEGVTPNAFFNVQVIRTAFHESGGPAVTVERTE
jgi:hypothetical protein